MYWLIASFANLYMKSRIISASFLVTFVPCSASILTAWSGVILLRSFNKCSIILLMLQYLSETRIQMVDDGIYHQLISINLRSRQAITSSIHHHWECDYLKVPKWSGHTCFVKTPFSPRPQKYSG